MAWRILDLAHKEFIQFFRDRQLSLFTLFGPLAILVMVASMTSSHITGLGMAVVDLDRTAESRVLVTLLQGVQALRYVGYVDSLEAGQGALDAGDVVLVVVVPAGFSAALNRAPVGDGDAEPARVALWLDGTNLIGALSARIAAQQAIGRFGAGVISRRWPGSESQSPVDLRTRVRFNPELKSSYNAIPAELSQVVYLVALIVSSTGLSKERERGTMEQLMVTPLSRGELILGKALPVIAIAFVDFLAMLAITVWVYEIPLRGSFGALVLLTLLFIVAEMGKGMTISAISATQSQSLLLVFIAAMFDMAFSGYLVPIDNMPAPLQWIATAVPLRYYMDGIRAVMIKGVDLAGIGRQCAALLVLGGIMVSLAAFNLRRRLD